MLLVLEGQGELMEDDSNSNTLSGTPVTHASPHETVFVNTGPVLPVQKNAAAQVIGWFVVVYGILQILGGLLGATDFGMTDWEGNPISTPLSYKVSVVLFSLMAAGLFAFGGYRMTLYEKRGIWIVFGGLALGYIGNIISSLLMGDAQGEGMELVNVGASGICGLIGVGVCGVIVAIPLMLSDGGME